MVELTSLNFFMSLFAVMFPRACICISCLLKEALFPLDYLRGEPKRIKKKKITIKASVDADLP